jgi:phage terminase large subunit-like protein
VVELRDIVKTLTEAAERKRFRRLDFFEPYPKQRDFMALGATHRERWLDAGNQTGKSYCGAAECAYHLTGEYPVDWLGRTWKRPVKIWAAGETSLVVRDVQQKLLCGEPGVDTLFGTGMIPKEAFVEKPTLARGVTDAYDTVQVKHLAPDGASVDGISVLRFKSYEQGRTKFQGEGIDVGWGDEEPPADVYSEFLTRTTATGGMVFLTFTPLLGMTSVVQRFLNEPSDDRAFRVMTILDAQHIPEDKRASIIAAYPPHEREARAMGKPVLGSGLIYQFSMEQIGENAIEHIPEHWTKLWSIDFGIADDHPFAAVLQAWDRDADCVHITHAFKLIGQRPLQHAAALKTIAANVPIAWPHDGLNREKGSGDELATIYRKDPVNALMLGTHATFPDGGISVEAGIMEINQRMETGRFKVAKHLDDWWTEQRMYHRKDGLIVKKFDDLMDATRVGIMAKRAGRGVITGSRYVKPKGISIASGVDFDPNTY